MKKIVALLMAILMIMSMVACAPKDEVVSNNESTNSQANDTVATATVGETLLADFKADTTGTAQEIADRLISNEIIQFMGSAMPIEEGEGQGSLGYCSPWGSKESETTEQLNNNIQEKNLLCTESLTCFSLISRTISKFIFLFYIGRKRRLGETSD